MTPRRAAPYLLLLILPLAANAVALGDWLSANPIHWMSGLSVVQPVTHPVIHGAPGWVDGNAGVTTQALGHLAANRWLQGEMPWWNEFSGIGLPLAAEMQNSALFLPFVLLLHFDNGLIWLKAALEVVGGWGMYAFLRQLGISRRAALTGAILFQFNGTWAWFSHGPIMPVAFLPWLLFGIERARTLTRQARPGGWVCIALAIAFSVVAGFPETAYLDGLLALTFAATRIAIFGPGRARLATKILAGGVVGLLLSAPAWVPFLQFVSSAYVGPHADFSAARLLPESYALLLFPYVFGPIQYGNEMIGEPADIWWHTGGYCGLLPVFLAAVALARRSGRDLGLRYVLAGWLALTLAKAGGVHPIARLIDMIPLIRQTMFFNYVAPSWQACLAVLAAFALDDWHRAPLASRWPRRAPGLAAGACLLLAAAALFAARAEIHRLVHAISGFAAFPIATIGLITGSMLASALILSRSATPRRSLALCGTIAVTSLALYGLPLLSGTRDRALNLQPVAFLQQHLGLSRFTAAPDPKANYGAYFEIAGINHNYLPVPQNWVDFLHARINPALDGVEFHGAGLAASSGSAPDAPSGPYRFIPTADILHTYEELAVRYLVLPTGTAPFGDWIGPAIVPANQRAFSLTGGQSFTQTLAPSQVTTGLVQDVGLQIGTYVGQARGVLTVALCDGSRCSSGATDAATARDNAVATLRLDPPLRVTQGDVLRARLAFSGPSPVAIWLWPQHGHTDITGPDPAHPADIPFLLLHSTNDAAIPTLVHRDAQFDIRELAHPSAYFTSLSAHCRLTPVSRTRIGADCTAPDTLIRRELFFPGWTVSDSRAKLPIVAHDTLLQSVALSPGHHDLKFRYQPPGIAFCYAAFCAGLLALAKARPSFSRTRSKKPLSGCRVLIPESAKAEVKVFWPFSSKKDCSLASLPPRRLP